MLSIFHKRLVVREVLHIKKRTYVYVNYLNINNVGLMVVDLVELGFCKKIKSYLGRLLRKAKAMYTSFYVISGC